MEFEAKCNIRVMKHGMSRSLNKYCNSDSLRDPHAQKVMENVLCLLERPLKHWAIGKTQHYGILQS